VIDIDDFHRVDIVEPERDRPPIVGPLVVVDRALVVGVMLLGGAYQGIHPDGVHIVGDQVLYDPYIEPLPLPE